MSGPTDYDAIHEAIRVVASAVGSPDETMSTAEVAREAATALIPDGSTEISRGWEALATGFAFLGQILLSDRMDTTGEAPLDALRSCAARFPRTIGT